MTVAISIHALAAGGDGVGRDPDGRAVFVAATAPGDQVRARIVESHARWARGELVTIEAPGPGRIEPACAHFAARRCGGCDWAHVDAATQHAAKHAVVVGAVRRLIAAGATVAPLVTPEPAWGWRRRVRLASTATALGLHAPRSHEVTDLDACPQQAPAVVAAVTAVRAARGALGLGVGEVHVAAGPHGAHVVIDAPCRGEAAAALVGAGGIVGVRWGGGHAGATTVLLEDGLPVAADEFAQAGAAGNRALRSLVIEAAALVPGIRVLELYAGNGNLTRDLVATGAVVTATDLALPRHHAAPGARFVAGPAAEVMAAERRGGAAWELIVLDPPRTGAREVIDAIAASGAARVVYVSCDPATFARDGERLIAAGWRPGTITPIDLMPQTAHVELVATFVR